VDWEARVHLQNYVSAQTIGTSEGEPFMQFYFIRHGESENNRLWRLTGSSKGRSEDPELTVKGQRQAAALARYLKEESPEIWADSGDDPAGNGFGITHLYSSLMVRSVATGICVARALDLPLLAWEELHERGGIYLDDKESGEPVGMAGKNRAFFETHYPDLVVPHSLGEAGWWNRPFEPYDQRPLRAQRFLEELLEKHRGTDDRVAVISHGGFYNDFLSAVLGLYSNNGFWFALNNAAITRIDFQDENTGLVYANRFNHLPRDLIT
jgi:2,3-bisphosphoglycerate-dependent phosphoglycerate mutase